MTERVALFLSPMPNHPTDGPMFVAGIAADEDATTDILGGDALPPLWEQHFTEHLLQVEMLSDVLKLDTMPEITHLALLESDMKENDPFYFGRTKIKHNSLVAWKHIDGTYRYFHCEKCAASVLVWMTENQEQWSKPLN